MSGVMIAGMSAGVTVALEDVRIEVVVLCLDEGQPRGRSKLE